VAHKCVHKKVQTNNVPAKHNSEANNVYSLRNTGALVNYMHKAMFICTKSALIHAVKKGHLATWPCLTEDAINKYFKLTPTTAMGHMNQKMTKHPINHKKS
jgi:hypothetical protein